MLKQKFSSTEKTANNTKKFTNNNRATRTEDFTSSKRKQKSDNKSKENEHNKEKRQKKEQHSEPHKTSKSNRPKPTKEEEQRLSKMTRKERKQEYITQAKAAAKERLQTKKPTKKDTKIQPKEEKDTHIFIIKHGKVSKKVKSMINSMKYLFQPHTNNKFEETNTFCATIYKNISKLYNVNTFFIFKENKKEVLLKVHDMENKRSVIYKVLDFEPAINKRFKSRALLTYNGFSERMKKDLQNEPNQKTLENHFKPALGKNIFKSADEIERVLNLTLLNQIIYLRHYELTKNEGKCVKVGIKELGPKMALEFIKEKCGELDEKW